MSGQVPSATILVVDDDAAARYATSRTLRDAGYEVAEASTGAEALQLVAALSVDLAVLDIRLPDTSGVEVARHLKTDPATACLPLLFLSASAADDPAVVAWLERWAGTYLKRPVSGEVLRTQVRALLRLGQAEQACQVSETRYRELFESMQEGFFLAEVICDASGQPIDGRFLEANSALARHTGFGPDQLVGKTLREVIPDPDLALLRTYAQVALTGEPARLEGFRPDMGRYIESYAYSPRPGQVAGILRDVTERTRAEESLRQSEARYRSLFEHMLDAYAYCRMLYEDGLPTDFIFLDANSSFERLTGLRDVVGKKVSEVIPGLRETDPELFETYGRVAGSGQPERFEVYLSALEMWFSISVYSPAPEHFVAVFDNITARKQAEAALLRKEAELTEAQRLARVGSWYWDVDTDAVTASEEIFRVLGLDPTLPMSVLREQERRLYAPGTWERVTAAVQEALRTGNGYELMVEARRADGSPVWIRARAEVVRGAEGRIIGLRGTNQDVTALKQAAQERERLLTEVAQQARLLDTIVAATDSRLAYLDRDLRYVRVNAAYADNARMAPEEFVGRHRLEVFPNAPEVSAMYQRVLDTGEPGRIEEFTGVPLYRPQVGLRTVRIEAVPVRDEQGEVVGVVTSMVDVTDSVRQRERLLAAERARAEIAEHLSDEIAHRVKNNLAMVSGLLQMQMLGEPEPHAAGALREAVGRIRTFVTLHEQMYDSHREEADLLVALQRIGATTGELFAARGNVSIRVLGEPFWCAARVATNLSVIANELITNALKHGGPGEDGRHVVEVQMHRTDEGVTLSVWNSGPPAPEDLDPAGSQSMGLRLVHDIIVGQYRGRFCLRPSYGGTEAGILVPAEALRADSLAR